MIVSWHGHACISIQFNGYTIVIDPHDGLSIGLKKPSLKADLVLVTHDHFDHNAVGLVSKEKTRVIKQFYGEAIVDDIKIAGYKTYHDKIRGKRRGENAVYVIEIKGVKIAHLGDLGEIPEQPVLERLAGVDLLAIPVGGTFTIEPDEAWSIVEKTKPLNIMPIHYWVSGVTLPLKPLSEFLKHVKGYQIIQLDSNSFELEGYKGSVIVPRPP